MESCKVCKFKSVDTIDKGFLCRVHGPMYDISVCKNFEPDILKLKANKCIKCEYFAASENPDLVDNIGQNINSYGTCMKFLLRGFDGKSRQSCSYFSEKIQNNIT